MKAGKTVRILKELSDKQRISAINAVKKRTGLGLKFSKKAIEEVIDGRFIDVEATSFDAAERLINELTKFGYNAERL